VFDPVADWAAEDRPVPRRLSQHYCSRNTPSPNPSKPDCTNSRRNAGHFELFRDVSRIVSFSDVLFFVSASAAFICDFVSALL
jgi:hypothetical protein